MKRLIVSAPFGNYIQPPFATATLGTFTAKARSGRTLQILRTVRWFPRIKAWVNKIGLRNPGMPWLEAKVAAGKIDVSDKIVSIHGFDDGEWYELIDAIARIKPEAVELNMSCPNVGHINWPDDLFSRAVGTDIAVIAKLPPVNYELMFEQALAAGIRSFHCCNTLPVDAGGMSGQPLKPVALQCIRRLPELCSPETFAELRIFGGGGIRTPADVDQYVDAGVHFIAVGTKVMNPKYLFSSSGLEPIRAQAESRLPEHRLPEHRLPEHRLPGS